MAIDFTLDPELEDLRQQVRAFITDVVAPVAARIEAEKLTGKDRIGALIDLRREAHKAGLWLPHMPEEFGGMWPWPWCSRRRPRTTTAPG